MGSKKCCDDDSRGIPNLVTSKLFVLIQKIENDLTWLVEGCVINAENSCVFIEIITKENNFEV